MRNRSAALFWVISSVACSTPALVNRPGSKTLLGHAQGRPKTGCVRAAGNSSVPNRVTIEAIPIGGILRVANA